MDTGDRFRKAFEHFTNRIEPDDPEFEAQVRMHLLPRDWPIVSKENATNVGDPRAEYNLAGIYFGPNATDSWKQEAGIGSLNPLPRTQQINNNLAYDNTHLPISTIYRDMYRLMSPEKWAVGVGAGANAATFAHEFRHHAKSKSGPVSDDTNHLLDVIASPSRGAYLRSVESAYNNLLAPPSNGGYSPTFADKEKAVLDAINSWNNKKSSRNTDPEYKIPNNIFQHYQHNIRYLSGDPQEKYNDKDLMETATGLLPRSMVNQRAAYPFLNFLGSNFYNDNAYAKQRAKAIAEWEAVKQKKAKGGSVTMPNNYRVGGRVRVI